MLKMYLISRDLRFTSASHAIANTIFQLANSPLDTCRRFIYPCHEVRSRWKGCLAPQRVCSNNRNGQSTGPIVMSSRFHVEPM